LEVIDDVVITEINAPVIIEVLANDRNPGGGALTVTDVTPGDHGSASVNVDQSVTYTPDVDYFGTDRFTYTVTDDRDATGMATVTVDVVNPVFDTLTGSFRIEPASPVLANGTQQLDWVAASDPHVILVRGHYHLYYTCCGIDGTFDCVGGGLQVRPRICLAVSQDGVTFARQPDNRVMDLGPAGTFDSCGMETAFVFQEGPNDFKMYYMGYDTEDPTSWFDGQAITVGSIGMAVSNDGIVFTRVGADPVLGPAPGFIGAWDSFALEGPWVIRRENRYWMYYGAAGSIDGSNEINAIGVAFSDDAVAWTKHAGNPVLGGDPANWDEYHTIDPCVLEYHGLLYMFYHGGDTVFADGYGNFHMGSATSSDGLVWDKNPDNPILFNGGAGSWTQLGVMAPSVMETPTGSFVMYFHGLDGYPHTVWGIGRAVPEN
jgi:predicted GH43/DUF377 family glycosyl hydrolase